MSNCIKLHFTVLFALLVSTAFAGIQWKPYEDATVEDKDGELAVQFGAGLSGIQTIVSLEQGTYRVSAELSGEGRVFYGLYSERKWTYSPDFKLSAEKQTCGFTFSVNAKGRYMIVLLSRKNAAKSLQVSANKLEPVDPSAAEAQTEKKPAAEAEPAKGSDTASAAIVWKPYEDAAFEDRDGELAVRFGAGLSGIQTIVSLEKGTYRVSAELSGEGRVFYGLYSERKWTYSPDFRLNAEKQTCSFTFSVNAKGRYMIVLLSRKNAAKFMRVMKIEIVKDEQASVAGPVAELPGEGGVSASFVRAAPQIDGKLDDAVWRENCVTLTPFLSHRTMTPAREKTTALIAYDSEHLYLGFKGEALALQAKSNQFSSFAQSAERDDDPQIFNNDYFAFLIADPESGNAFDFFFNAKGKVIDARTVFENLWGSRDVTWNSGARIGTRIEEGFWSLEAAIPWKSLGLAPAQGKHYRFHAGRFNARLREKSSWQFVQSSFHAKEAMGHLELAGEIPAVRIAELPLDPLKSCRFEAETAKDSLMLFQEVNGHVSSSSAVDGRLSATLDVGENPSLYYRYFISEPESKNPIVFSPRYEIPAGFPKLAVAAKSVPVYVNGEEVSAGSVTFNKAVTQIAFELTNSNPDFPKMMLKGRALSPADTFLYSATLPEGAQNGAWRLASFDDSSWMPANPYSAPKKGFYRKKYLAGTASIGPNWNENSPLYINAGMIQPVLVSPGGIKDLDTPEGCHLIVELPASLELLSASCFYKMFPSAILEEKRLGNSRRYRIGFPSCIRYQESVSALYQWCCLPLRAVGDAAGDATIYFHWETPDGKNSLVPRAVPVRFLPKLEPAKISGILQFWTWPLTELRDVRTADLMFDSILQTGATEVEDGRAGAGKIAFRKITLAGWSLSFKDFINAHPGSALIRNDGSADPCNACPLAILSPEGRKYFHEEFLRYLDKTPIRPSRIIWDFESSAWSGLAACICPNCFRTFAEKFKLEKVPENLREIREKHAAEWIRFQTENCAEIVKCLHQETMQVKIPLSVYSGYYNDFTRENYSIDWSLLAGHIELAVCGYGESGAALGKTIEALGPTPLLNSLILQPYSVTNPLTPAPISCARIMKTVMDSNSNGAMLFQYFLMDGRTFAAIAEASRIMAANERFLTNGKAAEGWKSSSPDVHFRQSGNEVLVMAINDSAAAQEYRITAPDGSVSVLKVPADGIILKRYDTGSRSFIPAE